MVASGWYCVPMESREQSLWDERKETRDAYKKGVREGWDQALWGVFGVGFVIFALTRYFPIG